MIMVDWITAVIPCSHADEILSGKIFKVTVDGVVEWERATSQFIAGSYDSSISVRTATPGESIYVSGNPVKFFQGHNLFGSNDLVSMNHALFGRIREVLDLKPTKQDLGCWVSGDYQLTRVDVTTMFDAGSLANARAWLRQAEQNATLMHRGRGQLTKGSTLYFGKHSRRWSAKWYAKGEEFQANGHQDLLLDDRLVAYADPAVRYEVVLRSMKLKQLGLEHALSWLDSAKISHSIIASTLERFNMSDVRALKTEQLDGMKPSLRAIVELWKVGYDIRGMYPQSTFYRLRSRIKSAIGVDIAVRQPVTHRGADVIPLAKPIELIPMGIPEWAVGTPLYYAFPKPVRAAN